MFSKSERISQKKWILEASAFEKMLMALSSDRDQASLIYEDLRKRLIRQFNAGRSVAPEEQADEVFNRISRKIAEESFILDSFNPYPYFHQTARYILLEEHRKRQRRPFSLDDLPPSNVPVYDAEEAFHRHLEKLKEESALNMLRECRADLSDRERLSLDLYDDAAANSASGSEKAKRRQQLAGDLKKSVNGLKIYINRIRRKLVDCAKHRLGKIS